MINLCKIVVEDNEFRRQKQSYIDWCLIDLTEMIIERNGGTDWPLFNGASTQNKSMRDSLPGRGFGSCG